MGRGVSESKMTADEAAPLAEASENDFCAGCGLCCDGTLFSQAVVQEDDPWAETGDFDLFSIEGKRFFRLPCSLLCDGRCSIHTSPRPKVCGDFRCRLLKRHESGELEPGEGRKRVTQAKELKAKAMARDPEAAFDGRRQSLWDELAEALAGASGAEKEELASRVLALAAFETYLRQWFRKKN